MNAQTRETEPRKVLRAAAPLELGFAPTDPFVMKSAPYVELMFDFVKGASSGFTFFVERRNSEAEAWAQESVEDATTGEVKRRDRLIADTSKRLYLLDMTSSEARIQVKAELAAGGTSLAIFQRAVYGP